MAQEMGKISLDDILITEELLRRVPRDPDLKAENAALRTLARQLVEQPHNILKTLVNLAKDLCCAGTAGVSLLETTPGNEIVFRWVAIAGALEHYEQETAPRFSPCGICLEHRTPQLYSYPARYFTDLQQVEPLIVEGLAIPLMASDQPLGVIWILSHDPASQFDAEDVRLLTSLADFTAAALHNKQIEETLGQREAELSLVTNTVPALISFVDAEQRYRFVNRTYEEWFGHPATEIYGKTLWDVLGEAAYQTIRPYVEQALAGQQVTFEGEVPYQDGGTRCVSITYVPRFDPQGTVTGFVVLVSDINLRKQAERALRQSEERLRIAQQAARAGVWDWDIVANRVTWSPEYYHLYGLDPATVQPSYQNWLASIIEQDREHVDRSARACLEQQTDLNVEFRISHSIHGERWITAIGQTFYDANRQPVRMTGIALDITDRKQAEEDLAQSEAQLRLIIESARDYAIFTLDMRGYITRWNSGAERLLGYQESEVIGRDGRIIFVLEDLERGEADREQQKALDEGQAENERWHVRKDGSRFWASGLIMPLRDEDNQIQGFLKILQDKTAQRLADERLHMLYETTSNLLATDQPLALMNTLFSKLSAQLDLHCYYNFLIEERDNQQKLHLINHTGLPDDIVAQIEWVEMGQYVCGRVAQQQRHIVLNQRQINTDPNAHFLRSMAFTAYACQPLIAQGRLLGTLSFASLTRTSFTPEEVDLLQVTCAQIAVAIERANLMASLQQQTEQLQQANRIKDEFLAVLSHELRSPLNPILGWSKLLQSRKLDEAKTAEALATIERNAKLQAELIEDLLDVSRILRGKLNLNMAPVDLVSTIHAAMETVRLAAEAKTIRLETELNTSTGKVLGDSARIQQVVWNLLSNAVKFTPQGGRVEVRLEKVVSEQWLENRQDNTLPSTIHYSPSTAYAQIMVTDTGKGITADFLPYVFDYFRQEDGATTRKFGGLGLGLAIVRHLVELHGGTIQVVSGGEGMGATFTVRLPLLENWVSEVGSQASSPDSTSIAPSSPLTGLQILVVDDDTDTRELIAFLLNQNGATVTSAASAQEALAILTQSRLDLLLSDIGMPDMDGYMLLRQVRTLPADRGGTILAIALTAYAGEADYQQAMAAGFQRHIPKPVEPERLVRTIIDLIGFR